MTQEEIDMLDERFSANMLIETRGLDQESAHCTADGVLFEALHAIGLHKTVAAFQEADHRCGGFWYS